MGDYERYVVNFSEEYIKKVLGSEEKAADILSQIKSGIFYLSESQTAFVSILFDELERVQEKKIVCNDMIFGCQN